MKDNYERESNTGFYFIVGGLVVFAIILGFVFLGNDSTESTLSQTAPAAGGYMVDDNTAPPRPDALDRTNETPGTADQWNRSY